MLKFSLSDYLYKYPLLPFAIKFAVKDLFPSTKIKFSFSYSNNHLTAHYLALHMGIGIILIPRVNLPNLFLDTIQITYD